METNTSLTTSQQFELTKLRRELNKYGDPLHEADKEKIQKLLLGTYRQIKGLENAFGNLSSGSGSLISIEDEFKCIEKAKSAEDPRQALFEAVTLWFKTYNSETKKFKGFPQ